MSRGTEPISSGQSSLEFTLVLGLIVVPVLMGGAMWVRTEWNLNECAFQSFRKARLELLVTEKKTVIGKVTLLPLEDLDQNKGGLSIGDAIKEVSQLWEQLSFSLPSLPAPVRF